MVVRSKLGNPICKYKSYHSFASVTIREKNVCHLYIEAQNELQQFDVF